MGWDEREKEREGEPGSWGSWRGGVIFWGLEGGRTPPSDGAALDKVLWSITLLTLKIVLEFKGQSEQCQPRPPLSQKALSEVTVLERGGGGGGGGGGVLRDCLVKKNLTRTRSRTLQHRSKDKLERGVGVGRKKASGVCVCVGGGGGGSSGTCISTLYMMQCVHKYAIGCTHNMMTIHMY